MKKILLASKSPRRREILEMLRIPFTVVTVEGEDESYPKDLESEEVAEYISNKKADAFKHELRDDELLVTADTVVILENKILGKPRDIADAKKMLHNLSGKTHKVATGVTVASNKKRESFTSISEVTFAHLSDEEINYYVDCFRPLDKAGAYGIQEWIGAVAVAKINGSFYNVMGLPVQKLYDTLKKF